jgi:hypothetical protein
MAALGAISPPVDRAPWSTHSDCLLIVYRCTHSDCLLIVYTFTEMTFAGVAWCQGQGLTVCS